MAQACNFKHQLVGLVMWARNELQFTNIFKASRGTKCDCKRNKYLIASKTIQPINSRVKGRLDLHSQEIKYLLKKLKT